MSALTHLWMHRLLTCIFNVHIIILLDTVSYDLAGLSEAPVNLYGYTFRASRSAISFYLSSK